MLLFGSRCRFFPCLSQHIVHIFWILRSHHSKVVFKWTLRFWKFRFLNGPDEEAHRARRSPRQQTDAFRRFSHRYPLLKHEWSSVCMVQLGKLMASVFPTPLGFEQSDAHLKRPRPTAHLPPVRHPCPEISKQRTDLWSTDLHVFFCFRFLLAPPTTPGGGLCTSLNKLLVQITDKPQLQKMESYNFFPVIIVESCLISPHLPLFVCRFIYNRFFLWSSHCHLHFSWIIFAF